MSGYDLIGDVHGHADELVALLGAMGYRESAVGGSRAFRHPERLAVFVGDLIDRGPKVRETLAMVRAMVEAGSALCVLGNHELNALGFHLEDPDRLGEFLRRHTRSHHRQHAATLEQVPAPELASHLAWFRTLPLRLELGEGAERRRIVHACWDEPALAGLGAALERHGGVTDEFLVEAFDRESLVWEAVEIVLKGKEMDLPDGVTFTDKDGTVRGRVRVRWYLPPDGHDARSYALQGSAEPDADGALAGLAGVPLPGRTRAEARPYPEAAPPVFVGHYWLSDREPELLAPNVACLDFSVARGGLLCAYRSDDEPRLERERFVWVPARS